MKKLFVCVAALGWRDVEKRGFAKFRGLNFSPAESAFPAVTCVAQASFRTKTLPRVHGMTSNGFYDRPLKRPAFWEQSANLVKGERFWERDRKNGASVGIFFWQQSLGEAADYIISPTPIHKHGGGMLMENYIFPSCCNSRLRKFPLHRYWGPLASPSVGNTIVEQVKLANELFAPDIALVYLPTLDYDLQRFGPSDERCEHSFELLKTQLSFLIDIAERDNAEVSVFGDYAIEDVVSPVVYPNITLRKAGLFLTRDLRGMAYPDFHKSRAFAMVDHQIAHVYVTDKDDVGKVAKLFESVGEYGAVEIKTAEKDWANESAGEIMLTARPGSWCGYRWWGNRSEAPDFSGHVDIHSKPGYDPAELFFDRSFPLSTCQDDSRIRGTHGRRCEIAVAGTAFAK